MKKVKITVLKTTLDEELVKEYGAERFEKACPMLTSVIDNAKNKKNEAQQELA